MMAVSLTCMPAMAHAANNCSWITEATASGLLGGNAVGGYTPPADGQPAVCNFTQQGDGASRTLRITVELATDPHARFISLAGDCGASAIQIKAIGNEALTCEVADRKGVYGEHVVGRVRDQVFTITLTTTLRSDPIMTRDALETRIYTAAEQVAGNLF
jgi:hypothetical protein